MPLALDNLVETVYLRFSIFHGFVPLPATVAQELSK